jgi:hypothetical protein
MMVSMASIIQPHCVGALAAEPGVMPFGQALPSAL